VAFVTMEIWFHYGSISEVSAVDRSAPRYHEVSCPGQQWFVDPDEWM
jgi:hypothetical protein